jgi:hypothetical protein
MRTDRRAIISLVALGRITPSEAERLILACNAGRDAFWIVTACVAGILLTPVLDQGITALLHVSRVLLVDFHPLHHALSFIHHLSRGIQ